MAVQVRIPTPLRRLTNGVSEVQVEGATVREAVNALEQQYPGMNGRICEDSGEIRRFERRLHAFRFDAREIEQAVD